MTRSHWSCRAKHLWALVMGRAQAIIKQAPTSGHLFLFFNRRRDKLKILYWEGSGLAIWYKRLEVGTFQVLTAINDEEGMEIEYWQLLPLLDELDLETGRRRKRFRLVSQSVKKLRLGLLTAG